jgi:hypothetical protein
MKKLSTLFVLISFIAVFGVLLSGCKKTENNPPTVIVTGVTEGAQYYMGQVPTVIITVGSNDGELVSLTINVTGAIAPTITDITMNPAAALDPTNVSSPFLFESGYHNVVVNYNPVINVAGTVSLQFTIKDSNDEIAQTTVTFTVVQPTIVTHSLELGDQSSAVGSFCASFEGEVYTLAQIPGNYAKIDMIYIYNTTWGDAIYSPDDSDIQNEAWIDWANWNPKNSTRFNYVTDTNFDFANATWQDIIDVAANAADYKAYDLHIGEVYGFKTVSNRLGILRITNVSGTVGGTIQFDVKIIQ